MNLEQLESLCLHDPLSYGITYIALPQQKGWEVNTRPWLPEIYQVVNPYAIEKNPLGKSRVMVVQKCTQIGLSTMGIIRMFHFCDYWPTRALYMLPRQEDVFDFVSTRIDPIIKNSPKLAKLLGKPDSTQAKAFGLSYLHFLYATIEPRMIPGDALFGDEVDLCDQKHLGTALNRMDASSWQLCYYFSTPTVPNYGINAMYETSDMRRWMVRCFGCNADQVLDWNKNLRIEGPQNNPKKVYYGCVNCNREITAPTIQAGRWVAEKPANSEHKIGYHLSQMMNTPAPVLWHMWRDPQTQIMEFYRKRLGMPYELGSGSLEREDFLVNCFDEPVMFESCADGKSRYYLGVDQGNELQVLIAKIPPDSQRPRIVHIEEIPFDDGFVRLAKLMRIYKIRRGVGDADPNRHSMTDIRKLFPGRFVLADYKDQRDMLKWVKSKKKVLQNVLIDRTMGMDALFKQIRDGRWLLPIDGDSIPPDTELLIDHATSLRRDVEIRKTSSGERQVGVYRMIRPCHLAHAWVYLAVAIMADTKKGGRTVLISPGTSIEEDVDDDLDIPIALFRAIRYYLDEVPTDQLEVYLTSTQEQELPFPLSYKLQRVLDAGFEIDAIKSTVQAILLERYQNEKRTKH